MHYRQLSDQPHRRDSAPWVGRALCDRRPYLVRTAPAAAVRTDCCPVRALNSGFELGLRPLPDSVSAAQRFVERAAAENRYETADNSFAKAAWKQSSLLGFSTLDDGENAVYTRQGNLLFFPTAPLNF